MEAYIGLVSIFAGSFAPRGWALCNGQLLSIAQNTAVFSILGTTYGGDGVSTFGLPNLQGCVPIGMGTSLARESYVLGQTSGTTSVSILTSNLPAHTHALAGTTAKGTLAAPTATSALAASDQRNQQYAPSGTAQAFAINSTSTGSSMPISIMQPYLALSFIICLQGLFPTRN